MLLGVTLALSACSSSGNGGSAPPTPTPSPAPTTPTVSLSGNWELHLTPSTGITPFPLTGGFINEQTPSGTAAAFTTGAFEASLPQPTTCFNTTTSLSLVGSVTGSQLGFSSFPFDGNVLTLLATADASAASLSGTYSFTTGCAKGATGTLTGQLYQPLTGTYTGPTTPATPPAAGNPAPAIALTLTQQIQGTGDGQFLLSGNAAFTGFPCFTRGTFALPTGGAVRGSAALFHITTDDPSGAPLTLLGTLDPAANQLQMNTIQVLSGPCAGTYGTALLTRP